jgi:N-acetylneuraminate synthase
MFGPDVAASVTTTEFSQLVEGVRFVEAMLANAVDKDRIAGEMGPMRETFMRSVVVRVDLPASTVLRAEHLAVKKPGGGIPPSRLPELLGKRLRRAVCADEQLDEADLMEGN